MMLPFVDDNICAPFRSLRIVLGRSLFRFLAWLWLDSGCFSRVCGAGGVCGCCASRRCYYYLTYFISTTVIITVGKR